MNGRCEGADSIASGVVEDLVMPALEKDFAAVVPFPIVDYRDSRDTDFVTEFDQQLAACSYVVVLDGIYDKPKESTTPPERLHLSNRRRAPAYRCQSALLLRQSALLGAVVNPDPAAPWKPSARPSTSNSPSCLSTPTPAKSSSSSPATDLLAVLTHDSGISTGWQETLATWVTQITADPERSEDATGNASASHGLGLMNEFFHQASAQPGSHPVEAALDQ